MKKLFSAVVVVLAAFATSAHAALDQVAVTAIQTEVLSDVDVALTAGLAVMAVVLASSIGMSLLGKFMSKGASGG